MRTPDQTHFRLKRLHAVFAVSAIGLLAATVWMVVADHCREWKNHQRAYREAVGDESAGSRRPGIEQIHLPELTLDHHFARVGRTDRCMTCHQGIETPRADDLAQPLRAHPRLDLFVGPNSPHPMGQFGCTSCHAGQGRATEFRFASHSPNDMRQRAEWRERHGWFRDENWDEPMLPRRFAESGCLACHHDVTDLEPSPRFPDPPAPKLLAGYHLVRQLGCFGCHEISGVGPSGESIGPDMRLETSAARASASSPGTMRKVGPSLRDVASRLDTPFLTRWIANPAGFRPATRMPRLFGLHEHLDAASRDESARLEAIEVGAVAEWLRSVGEPVEPLAAPAGVTERPSVERGRELLLTQGCLACHKHDDYPEATGTQGADLSRLAEKYTSPAAAGWLADWLRDPARHSPRTTMPNPLLETVVGMVEADEARMDKPSMPPGETDKPSMASGDESKLGSGTGETPVAPARMDKPSMPPGEMDKPSMPPGEMGKPSMLPGETGKPSMASRRSDPVADLVAYLLAPGKSKPTESETKQIPTMSEADLESLLPADAPGELSRDEKLDLVARQTIAKRGCFGCHDLPGFESAQPIGPALSDWGRKDRSLLAFGRIDELLAADGTAQQAKTDADTGFYLDAVRGRHREGFLWQKLREPRSFDHGQTDRKTFNEHLRMGRFTLSPSEREAIATFVLGLTGRPPTVQYVHQPDAAGRAIVEGRKVLDRFACAECHIIEMNRWRFAYNPDEFDVASAAEQFDFLIPRFCEKQLAASRQTDASGLAHAEVIGMPRLDDQGRPALFEGDREDDQGDPLPMRAFTLWQPAAIDGRAWPVGGPEVLIYDDQITKRYPAWGGAATTLLYPAALARARAAGVNVTGLEAWGALPPPLVDEGAKVRAQWLIDYLLDPQTIRPSAMMKMPKYAMSAAEAKTLADFFAAHAGTTQTDLPDAPTRRFAATTDDEDTSRRRDQAMRVLIDRKTFCAKCHVVGDYQPPGATATVGPDLMEAGRRLQAEYIRRWLADPRATLPYTPMPVNFPPSGEPLGQDLLPGASIEQINAMTDLLEHYDDYLRSKTSIRETMNP